jgi:predicted nucleic acid-binding protein
MPERLVIADTSPLLYLHQARQLNLLRELYGTVTVPAAVRVELETGRQHGYDVPDVSAIRWIRSLNVPDRSLLPAVVDLGPGESEVIALGLANPGSLVLLDGRLARRIATLSGLTHTGTLGVLLKAKSAGHLPAVRPVLEGLRGHGMRIHDDLMLRVLTIAEEL